jgi:hypothetical protein
MKTIYNREAINIHQSSTHQYPPWGRRCRGCRQGRHRRFINHAGTSTLHVPFYRAELGKDGAMSPPLRRGRTRVIAGETSPGYEPNDFSPSPIPVAADSPADLYACPHHRGPGGKDEEGWGKGRVHWWWEKTRGVVLLPRLGRGSRGGRAHPAHPGWRASRSHARKSELFPPAGSSPDRN